MIEYDRLYNDVREKLSEHRFKHSLGVVKRALEYAGVYNVDLKTVKLAAIAHDIAKDLSKEEITSYIEKYKIKLSNIEKQNPNLLHAIIASFIVQEEYGFTSDMVNAVRYHTTGRENMSILEKIIYLADATEENRKYCSNAYVDLIKKDIDKGMIEINKWVIKKLLDNDELISLDGIKCYNYYCNKITNNESK